MNILILCLIRFYHLSDNYKKGVLLKRPITLPTWTTVGVSFQNKKETDFANLIKGGQLMQAAGYDNYRVRQSY